MHERSLVRALLSQVETIRSGRAANRVLAVKVTVGEFSGVEVELLRSAFKELALEPTIAGAELQIERVPLQGTCRSCGETTMVKNFRFECDHCEGRELDITAGEEMVLESLTLAGD